MKSSVRFGAAFEKCLSNYPNVGSFQLKGKTWRSIFLLALFMLDTYQTGRVRSIWSFTWQIFVSSVSFGYPVDHSWRRLTSLLKEEVKLYLRKKGSTAIINLTNWSESDEWYQWWAIMMKMMKIVMMRCITVWASAIITDIFRFSCRNAVSSLITSANWKVSFNLLYGNVITFIPYTKY